MEFIKNKNSTNLYDILQVKKNCSKIELKKSYHKLILKYHPDKCINTNIAINNEKFIEIRNAYQILNDPIKRQKYDFFIQNL